MTIVEMLNWFDLLQDKYGTPYFTDDEKVEFVNRAQTEFVNQFLPDTNEDSVNVELNSETLHKLRPLIFELSEDTMDTSGKITEADITTNLQTISGEGSASFIRILSIEIKKLGKKQQAKLLRHNDKAAFEQNVFKKPAYGNYKFLFQNNSIQFRPTDTAAKIYFTVLKTPINVVNPGTSCQLPQDTHNEIVAIALEFAGYASREEILTQIEKAAR